MKCIGLYIQVYFSHMVKNVAHTTRIDKQGRLIIPTELRKQLSLEEGTIIDIEVNANLLILKKQGANSQDVIDKWKTSLLSPSISSKSEISDLKEEKWYSEEYVTNKLGF